MPSGECFEYLICEMLPGGGESNIRGQSLRSVAGDFSIQFGVRALNSFCANIRAVR